MKYIITESRLDDMIYIYIDKELKSDNIRYINEFDYHENKPIDTVKIFVGDSTDTEVPTNENIFFDYYFRYAFPEYYKNSHNTYFSESSPILFMDTTKWNRRMESIFGDKWHSAFERWFTNNYPEFPVKTFYYFLK